MSVSSVWTLTCDQCGVSKHADSEMGLDTTGWLLLTRETEVQGVPSLESVHICSNACLRKYAGPASTGQSKSRKRA